MKALVFDLDDTLLNSAKEIGPQTQMALDEWLASGRVVCFATSRPVRWVRKFIPKELFRSCEIITMNGAVLHSGGERVYKSPVVSAAARSMVQHYPRGEEIYFSLEKEGEDFSANASSSDKELWERHAATRDMVTGLDEVDFGAVSKMTLNGLGKRIDHLVPWLKHMGVEPILSDEGTFINVVASGIDKSATLARCLERRQWARSDFAVFGDDLPDIKMMKLSDHAVAMGNAKPEVKAVAHEIIGHCDDDCIGPYLRRWLL